MHPFSMKFGFGKGRHRHGGKHGHSHGHTGASSLSLAPIGSDVRVLHISGGPEASRKLLDMGILPGEVIHVMRNDSNGPLLVRIHGGSVMLGRGLAEKIRVQQE